MRHGKKSAVEAVSGADVVEKASTHVRRMRELFDEVLAYGDKLVYKGVKDEALPPALSLALDNYLNESQPKLLVVQPVRDEREKDNGKPARSVLLLEGFNPPEAVEPMLAKLDIVAKHAAPALYNAWDVERIPFRFVWSPVTKLQEFLGGKAKLYLWIAAAVVAALTVLMVLVPYPLKMQAKGEFLPKNTVYVFPPTEGTVKKIFARPGDHVREGATLVELHSSELQNKLTQADSEIQTAVGTIRGIEQFMADRSRTAEDQGRYVIDRAKAESKLQSSRGFISFLMRANNAADMNGNFRALAPRVEVGVPGDWEVLSSDNRDELLNRTVRGNEPLMRIGAADGPWRVELKIPQRNIGHIARAFASPGLHHSDAAGKKYLDVDVLLTSRPDTKFPGRLYDEDMSKQAVPNKDDHNESEPIVQAPVRVNLEEFGPAGQIPKELRVAGVEAHIRIRCGDHALGYSLFHGVWEWFYEKVVFFF
jgi:hypothetical protein